MSLLRRLLLFTFIESVGTIFIERGEMFLTKDVLHFSDTTNLWLALLFGAGYAAGSLSSHKVAQRVGEKRLVQACLAGQIVVCTAMGFLLDPVVIFVGSALLAAMYGLKWAVTESYVSAGLDSRQTANVIGIFNITWSGAVPVALLPSGMIIRLWQPGLFYLPVFISLVSWWLMRPVPASPLHRELPEPNVESRAVARRTAGLLAFSRWQLLGSYALLWILAALTPGVFKRLGYDVRLQTVLAAILDTMRVAGFYLLYRTIRWHGRFGPLFAGMLLMPLGFALVLLAPNVMAMLGGQAAVGTAVALGGEMLYGLAAAMVYYAALYYAMVHTNAAVHGGGSHEGVIGLGFTLGPAAGLLGAAVASAVGGLTYGTLIVVAPLVAAGMIGSVRAYRATRAAAAGQPVARSSGNC